MCVWCISEENGYLQGPRCADGVYLAISIFYFCNFYCYDKKSDDQLLVKAFDKKN